VADQAKGQYALSGTTRNASRLSDLRQAGIEPFLLKAHLADSDCRELKACLDDAYVLVSFPPDPANDQQFASLAEQARAIVYISSTGVYGLRVGVIDENTEADFEFQSAKPRLWAERIWRERGAIVLRAPGLYGPSVGLHKRLREGSYRLPEDGSNYSSRIHLKDLARIILAAFQHPLPKTSTYPVGDLEPATQKEVVGWLCARMNLAMPESVPLDSVPLPLRGNRRVSASKILSQLGIKLEFPTYREGFAHCLSSPEFKSGSEKELAD
jgi:nucleoside-diphosphate-sugar epimerase